MVVIFYRVDVLVFVRMNLEVKETKFHKG
jgi:hypothetical protein